MKKKSKPLISLFDRHLTESGLIPRGSKVLVAVSGGVDSVVLLDLLTCLAEKMKLRLGVGHFNHRTRGQESDADESFVTALASGYGLPFYRGSLPDGPTTSTESWEAYARRHRYRFLEKVRDDEGFDWIATAHHGDDQAETILMRVIEGSGVRGLMGIRQSRLRIVRPLLLFAKTQILRYARENALAYCEDETNRDTTLQRNFIRHELLPRIRKLNPNFLGAASQLAHNMCEVDELIDWEVQQLRKQMVSRSEMGHWILDFTSLCRFPMVVQENLIHALVAPRGGVSPWRRHVWLSLETFLRSSSTGEILHLPRRWELLKDRDRLLLWKRGKDRDNFFGKELEFTPQADVALDVGEYQFTMNLLPTPAEFPEAPTVEYANFSLLLDHRLKLRPWKPGDRMKPLGTDGYKKVSDILVDRKIDRFRKNGQFVLTADDQIVWLCGVQLDHRFRVREGTTQTARLSWSRSKD